MAEKSFGEEVLNRSRVGLVFPGQALTVGEIQANYAFLKTTDRELTAHYLDLQQACVDEASRLGGVKTFDIAGVLEDPGSPLYQSTRVMQPIIYILSCLSADLVKVNDHPHVLPVAVTGHSLGLIAASRQAGVFTLEEGARISAVRGILFEREFLKNPSTLMRVMGLTEDQIKVLQNEEKGWFKAIINGLLVSAHGIRQGDQQAFIATAKKLGAKKMDDLGVPAFHTPYMEGAVPDYAECLNGINFQKPNPNIHLISNITGEEIKTADEIRRVLIENVDQPINWLLALSGMRIYADHFVHLGPCQTLNGLARVNKVDPGFVKNTQELIFFA